MADGSDGPSTGFLFAIVVWIVVAVLGFNDLDNRIERLEQQTSTTEVSR